MTAVGSVVRTMGVGIDTGTGVVQYECAVTKVAENESHDTQTTQVACPDGTASDVGPSTWAIDVDYNVDWAPTSLHRILRAHAGETATLTWQPDPEHNPGVTETATVTLVPGAAQQQVGAYRTASVSLPCIGQPTILDD